MIANSIGLTGKEKLLDVGTSSGSLIIKVAKAHPLLELTGIDYWGFSWEYSKKLCEENAQIEAVSKRTKFIKASASKLPFKENEFDILISCLTYHEIDDEKDKTKLLKESFRVLKRGGKFVLLDLFLDENLFGKNNDFTNFIHSMGLSKVEIIKLDKAMKLPRILLSKKSLGNALIIQGIK